MPAPREPFARRRRWATGYDPGEVDGFLAELDARQAAAASGHGAGATPEEIRRAGFTLVRGGYDVAAVDQALDALEERAVALERAARPHEAPPDVMTVLRPRLELSPGDRFARAGVLRRGYDPDEVDDFCDRLARALLHVGSAPLGADDVRAAAFTERLRGYDEDAVDAFLDDVVDVLLRSAAS